MRDRPHRCSSLWTTSDFSIAAYLRSVGVPLYQAKPQNGSGRHCDFIFSDAHDQCPQLAIKFVGSDAGRFDLAQRAIKKLAFGWRDRGLAGTRGDWKTPDVRIAAWIVMAADPEIELCGFRRTHGRRREYEFYFSGSPERIAEVVKGFGVSNARRYSEAQKALHDMINGKGGAHSGSFL
jgi:hypothetical protein